MLRRDDNTDRVQTAGTLGWQVTNQSVNVGINFSNANKSRHGIRAQPPLVGEVSAVLSQQRVRSMCS